VLLIGARKPFTGFLFHLTGLLYSVLRFIIDFTRYYGADERLGGLSHNQIVCIVLFVIFGGLILKGLMFGEEAQKPKSGDSALPPADPPPQNHA
jgi:prolipoprotein diacylglyceryltransferase